MKRILSLSGAAVAATALLTSGLAGTAQAGTTVHHDKLVKPTEAQSVALYWLGDSGANLKRSTQFSGPSGNLDSASVKKVVSTGGAAASTAAGSISATSSSTTSTSKNINLPKTIGKVFFLDGDGKPRWCSATSIVSTYKNLVATAGHCVYNTAANTETMDKWVFIPGYYQGKAPWGLYVGKTAYTHYDFSVYEDYDRDYAFVTVYNGVELDSTATKTAGVANTGYSLGSTVGAQGFAWNQKTGTAHFAFGYPASAHPDGNKPYTGVTAKWAYGKTSGKTPVSSALKIDEQITLKAAFTWGADGGPWLIKYSNTKRTGYIDGVTSLVVDSDDNDRYDTLSSAYFDGETKSVYSEAAASWSGNVF
ncbi:trypsin-like serine peptidase [Microtetraspora glauca]|uniref:Trypsin-like serine protease n=1 Tax=Microtetraspora glauca TaxID=1996 RepID=A0ABV3GEZ3_MICGL